MLTDENLRNLLSVSKIGPGLLHIDEDPPPLLLLMSKFTLLTGPHIVK